jgi:hypothetical protein
MIASTSSAVFLIAAAHDGCDQRSCHSTRPLVSARVTTLKSRRKFHPLAAESQSGAHDIRTHFQ